MSPLLGPLTLTLGIMFKSSLCAQPDSLPPFNVAFLGPEGGRRGEALRTPGPWDRRHSSVPTSAAPLTVRYCKA